MLRRDIENTYKDFLVVLCGILIFCIGGSHFTFALYLGMLLSAMFSVKLLNTLLYKSVFKWDGSLMTNNGSSQGNLIRSKVMTVLCYAIVSVCIFLFCRFFTNQEGVFSMNLTVGMSIAKGSTSWISIVVDFLSGVVSLLVSVLFLFIIMLLYNLKLPGGACGISWLVFCPLNLILSQLLQTGLTAAVGSFSTIVVTNLITLIIDLLLAILFLAIISAILKKSYSF